MLALGCQHIQQVEEQSIGMNDVVMGGNVILVKTRFANSSSGKRSHQSNTIREGGLDASLLSVGSGSSATTTHHIRAGAQRQRRHNLVQIQGTVALTIIVLPQDIQVGKPRGRFGSNEPLNW